MRQFTADQVRAEVQRFWNAFAGKDAQTLADFYAHESSVFGSSATRSEPGRLAATRRQREYFGAHSTLKATLGAIDVAILADGGAAVADYTFQFHASKVMTALGSVTEENIKHGRATQVFAFDPDGKVRIVHEHLSTVDKPS
ncbi:MAG: nuclear transport factor 2 family protein [Acidobacteriota bacterium]|nr:nuclear transport factor 2 family protein [Acidobacteriota bacterium]